MEKKVISTDKAPGAIGPYSQGICIGNVIYTSGQIPVNMENGELVLDDIRLATRCSLSNVKAILEAEGATMDDVVKTTVFITDLGDFTALNEEYAKFFGDTPPARSCVQVAALPKGVKVEIEAIAIKK